MNVAERSVEVKNLLGLNLGAAAALAGTANKFTSQIMIALGKNQVSAKSIVQLIILGAGLGSNSSSALKGAMPTRLSRRFKLCSKDGSARNRPQSLGLRKRFNDSTRRKLLFEQS